VSKVSGTCAPLGLANKVASPASNRVLMAFVVTSIGQFLNIKMVRTSPRNHLATCGRRLQFMPGRFS
jgi:hypothetical protein